MEKEMIQNYAVENSVNVGGKRFLFCISTDENEPHPYSKIPRSALPNTMTLLFVAW